MKHASHMNDALTIYGVLISHVSKIVYGKMILHRQAGVLFLYFYVLELS